MKLILRTMLAILAAMLIAVPSFGDEGGGNAGGVGVWILPRCGPIGGPVLGATAGSHQLPDFTKDLRMTVSQDCGQVVATACDPSSALIVPLAVSGRDVTLSSSTIQAFSAANVSTVEILIVDPAQHGYRITIAINSATQSASLSVH